jgi:hypothetical protein
MYGRPWQSGIKPARPVAVGYKLNFNLHPNDKRRVRGIKEDK